MNDAISGPYKEGRLIAPTLLAMKLKTITEMIEEIVWMNLYTPTTLPYWSYFTLFYIIVIEGATKPLESKMQSGMHEIETQKLLW